MITFPLNDFAETYAQTDRTFHSFCDWFLDCWEGLQIGEVSRDHPYNEQAWPCGGRSQNRLFPFNWGAAVEFRSEQRRLRTCGAYVFHTELEDGWDDAFDLAFMLAGLEHRVKFGSGGFYLIDIRSEAHFDVADWYWKRYHASKDVGTGRSQQLTAYLFTGEQLPLAFGERWAFIDISARLYFARPDDRSIELPIINVLNHNQ